MGKEKETSEDGWGLSALLFYIVSTKGRHFWWSLKAVFNLNS